MSRPEGGGEGRLMAFDVGQKRIGVALSDEKGTIAFPLATVSAVPRAAALASIRRLIEEHRPQALVVGLPLNMDGSHGPAARKSEAFARTLSEACGLPVSLWDERLTTAWAERSLIEADLSRRRRREVVDQAAAAILLQGYLERRRGEG